MSTSGGSGGGTDQGYGFPGVITPNIGFDSTIATTGFAAARVQYGRVFATRTYHITEAAFVVTTAATVNDSIEIGIYDGATGAQVATSGPIAGLLNATGNMLIPLVATLQAGKTYYVAALVAVVGGTAAIVNYLSVNSTNISDIFGPTIGLRIAGSQNAQAVLPATMAFSASSLSAPLIALRES